MPSLCKSANSTVYIYYNGYVKNNFSGNVSKCNVYMTEAL